VLALRAASADSFDIWELMLRIRDLNIGVSGYVIEGRDSKTYEFRLSMRMWRGVLELVWL
jgi:hypothetical protein